MVEDRAASLCELLADKKEVEDRQRGRERKRDKTGEGVRGIKRESERREKSGLEGRAEAIQVEEEQDSPS